MSPEQIFANAVVILGSPIAAAAYHIEKAFGNVAGAQFVRDEYLGFDGVVDLGSMFN